MPRARSLSVTPSTGASRSKINPPTDGKDDFLPPSRPLGKRKRAQSQQGSPSPDSGLAEPKRKRGRPTKAEAEKRRAQSLGPPVVSRSVRAGSLGPGKAPASRKSEVLVPESHPRPCRQLFIWGNGDMGQFGLGPDTLGDIVRPRLHSWFEEATREGKLGGEGAGLEVICAGGMHSLVIDEAGKVWSWGINDNAALGRPTVEIPDPSNPGKNFEPEELETQPKTVDTLVEDNFRAVKVAGGDSVSVALGSRGDIRVWGSFRASDGLLGFDGKEGSPKTQVIPIALSTLQQYQFVDVACGTDHVLALTSTGIVWVWGNGQQSQLGRKIIERRKINGLAPERLSLRKIAFVGSGSYHSFAVDREGNVYAWGLNSMKQTGVSQKDGGSDQIIPTPTIVSTLSPSALGKDRRVVQIAGGEHHTLFLLSDGSVWGCGRCDGFELGIGEDHPAMKGVDERRAAHEERWKRKRGRQLAKVRVVKAMNSVESMEHHDQESSSDKPPPIDDFIPEPVPILFPPPLLCGSQPQTDSDAPPTWTDDAYTSPPADPIIHISAGTRHNLAVSKSGYVYAWGFSTQCALGLGKDVEFARVPTRVRSKKLDGDERGTWLVEKTAAGGQHCLMLARWKDKLN
ncbi:regulator of chromosome condensation 1/beta-lactamase-inhibitor protein II [Cantharellus anzutake]|uniref:regulator of chromosome condensation 1/beta-lactamase-inhibitor protein II n=1 Tax=Cantharellus anzutake TaxID=1750568 RepID=UPI001903C7BB|nr:regulator of chromosome condensation 1/beta-lactamase-inhibitor protein II [Cantharellus anzutake]KAF8335878.1 regulator of chromosome condensation 1/beta-lactamase-inhibitor protein II [Cantharellus anzutake]